MRDGQWIPIVIVIAVGYVGWLLTAIALYHNRRKMDTQDARDKVTKYQKLMRQRLNVE